MGTRFNHDKKARARALISHATRAIEPCLPPVQPFKEGINLYLSLTFTLRLSTDKSWLGERGMMMKSRARYNRRAKAFSHFMYIKHASVWRAPHYIMRIYWGRSFLPSFFFFFFFLYMVRTSGGKKDTAPWWTISRRRRKKEKIYIY